ncbi:hypothetical protein SPRG_05381 [Saprolegnia parasitica CBS 223.65]|uniref:RING-type domain-containing protein n=1 Tax=Saprolegnia parasitica (strain CBS 223.65) TaxID=695850 RepID=A0A067CF71_SAPPC|nr:hypothetical protein SPRG_05381 [Saprolegnia parasitica CBS 223.65]KDO29138.1 hypothetical protein SPRG_05381 [Saprolegnia parasitica CBS 223.65]|eukprot:XP_012200018.1 hypothetical protein SPRG_05381 [Saprolegnia parasitica CBS 223.65]
MVLVEVDVDDIRCAICLDVLTTPATLACGHSFDLRCVRRLRASPCAIACPVCRAPMKASHLQALRVNTFLAALVQRAAPLEYAHAVTCLDDLAPPVVVLDASPPLTKMPGFLFACYALIVGLNAVAVYRLLCV